MSTNFEKHREKKARKRAEKRAAREAEQADKAARQPMTFGPDFGDVSYLSPGDAIPARWNFYNDGRVWIQKSDRFITKLGPANVYLGTNRQEALGGYKPYKVENCLFPDGTRGTAFAGETDTVTNLPNWRRPTSDNGQWWPGYVKFSLDDAVFRDRGNLLPVERISDDEHKSWLAGALMGEDMPENKIFWTEFYNACTESETLKSSLRIDTFAWAFWTLFINDDLFEQSTGREVYYTSDRRIGEILSRLRACGEDYLVFYHGHPNGLGPEPTDKDMAELKSMIEEIGFVVDKAIG